MEGVQVEMNRDVRDIDWTEFVRTGSGTLAGRYLRRFWQPVFRSQDLKPGKATPLRIMSEDFTLYRGQTGGAHALAFRCAHRGTQLSTGWVEGDNLRCRYHGWTYDASGQCVHQPAEPEPFCQKVQIRAYPVQDYLGLIFVYMGDDQAPPLPRYPQLELAGELDVSSSISGCNYFNNLENAVDELHPYFLHWRRQVPVGEQVIPRISAEETDYGMQITVSRPDARTLIWHWHMPNCLQMNTAGYGEGLHWKVPIDDEHYRGNNVTLVPPGTEPPRGQEDPVEHSKKIAEVGQAIRAGKLTLDEIDIRDGGYVPIGDDVAQLGQGAIADRRREMLGGSDAGVILLRSLWKRDLRALAEGQPLKEWKHPPGPLVSTPRLYERGAAGFTA